MQRSSSVGLMQAIPNPESRIPASHTRIMGIDPGSRHTGIGIIDIDAAGATTHVFHCAINLVANENFALRLKQIFAEICAVIDAHAPQEVAIERVFMARNPDSALKLGQARGAAICAVVHHDIEVAEYAAREIKLAVVGGGGADKQQVQHMVGVLLGLEGRLQADAADALAVAIAHAHTRSTTQRLGIPRTAWRRRR